MNDDIELHPIEIENIQNELLLEWICDNLMRIGSINRSITSYGLKHLAERQLGFYVSNDKLIDTMIFAGFKFVGCSPDRVNLYFNVSQKSINKLKENQSFYMRMNELAEMDDPEEINKIKEKQ